MSRKTVSAIMMSLLVLGTLALAFSIQPVRASGTITIRADGSVDPPTVPISTADNITYMFTDNIYDSSGISVQRSDIVVNGNGYVLNSKFEYGRGNYGFGLTNVNNVTIENTSIRDFGYGIIIDNSNDSVILGNNITGSLMDGVGIDSSTNNSLYGNWIEGNSWGIDIFSPHNLVYGNWISSNWMGIRVGAPNINLTKNLFSSNNYQLSIEQESSDWRDYIDFIDSSNLIDGKPVYFLMNEKDLLITPETCPDIGYLGLVNCANITIENLTLRSNGQGLLFANTNNSRVIRNNIESNGANVELSSSFDNTFSENNITDDEFFGAFLMASSNNRFYHNNFIFGSSSLGLSMGPFDLLPTGNTWDDGYPSGGNYWSDYKGTDLRQGPYQNETGSDGIGDAPYTIYANNLDNYPLMNPWSPPDIAVTDLTSAKTVIGQGYIKSINVAFENLGNKIEAFNTTVYTNSTCIYSEQTLLAMTNCTLSFVWNTTGFAYGNYTLNAYAEPVQGEINTANNNCPSNVPVHVGVPGDVSSTTPGVYDGITNMTDIAYLVFLFNTEPNSPNWNPNADVNNDGVCNMKDTAIAIAYFNQHE